MEKRIKQLELEITRIKARNHRVELDKAWEISKTRTAFIALGTFILLFGFMKLIGAEQPFWNALVSIVAYWISTETYGVLKRWWIRRNKV